ncbi:MAG TPA: TlpA disulfide reductase family protein [Daejeonella sp.]|nr:TlpA disulfide reductase family protein [Daejeonella sp.]
MAFLHSFKLKWMVIVALTLLAVLYFNVDARTLVVRGLMRTGLFKADIKNDRIKLIKANSWKAPAEIAFINADGREVKLAEKKGKVLFINFWATWCPPCRAEMPSISALQRKLKDNAGVEIMMVEVDKKPEAAINFMRKGSYNLPVYSPSSFIPPEIFDGNLPTTMVISPDGTIVYHHIGAANYDHPDFLKFISDLSK